VFGLESFELREERGFLLFLALAEAPLGLAIL
jgi:hypothetical protein